jgi:hypothetical protein
MAVFAGISAAVSIGSGIFGASQASKANAEAEAAARKARRRAKKIAKATNEYNLRVFETDKQNYANTRAYEWETAVKNWQYNQSIQDFKYLQAVKEYGKSVENTRDQLTYNNIAAMQAYESEQAALNELLTEDRFNRQDMLVAQLQSEGKSSLGQAGRSRTKALQASIADMGRNAAIMDASLSSSFEQSQRNMFDISLSRYGADMQAKASMMIQPERALDIPMPTQGPERIWIEPMEVFPETVGAPIKQSTVTPILSGLTSGLNSLASIDWNPKAGGKG